MKKLLITGAVAAVVGGVALNSDAGSGKTSADKSASVARGEYLVKNVAGCPDCHTHE
jgi:hypothetical protein